MPNHVTTRCIMTGPTEDIALFCALHIRVPDEAAELTLDFDRIIPMPEILKRPGAAYAKLGIEILTGKPKPGSLSWSFLDPPWVQQLGITTHEALRAWAEKEHPEAIEEGRKQIEAYNETGFYDWYDWSIENWGTKWNSYRFAVNYEVEGELSFCFDTAWSFPIPIFTKLAEMFPNICFECACLMNSGISRERELSTANRRSRLWKPLKNSMSSFMVINQNSSVN
jgi:hypothetical protein